MSGTPVYRRERPDIEHGAVIETWTPIDGGFWRVVECVGGNAHMRIAPMHEHDIEQLGLERIQ